MPQTIDKLCAILSSAALGKVIILFFSLEFRAVRSFTGMDRNGPNYRDGLPEWTIKCAPEYFS